MNQEKQSIERQRVALDECKRFSAAVVSNLKLLPIDIMKRHVASLFVATMLDHYCSIIHLFGEERYDFSISAFVLVRPIIDSAFRGVWIANFAKDEEIDSVLTANGYEVLKKINPGMLYGLMKKQFNIDDSLQDHFKEDWKSVHGFVHTGTEQLKQRVGAIRSRTYPYEKVIAALVMSSQYVMVGSVYVAYAQNADVALSISEAHDNLRRQVVIVQTDKSKSHMVN